MSLQNENSWLRNSNSQKSDKKNRPFCPNLVIERVIEAKRKLPGVACGRQAVFGVFIKKVLSLVPNYCKESAVSRKDSAISCKEVQFLAKRELSLVFGYSHQLDVKLEGGVGLDDCALAGRAVSHVVGHDDAAAVANVHAWQCYCPSLDGAGESHAHDAVGRRGARVGRVDRCAVVESQLILHVDLRAVEWLEVTLGKACVVEPVHEHLGAWVPGSGIGGVEEFAVLCEQRLLEIPVHVVLIPVAVLVHVVVVFEARRGNASEQHGYE